MGTNGNGNLQKLVLKIAIATFVVLTVCMIGVTTIALYPFEPVKYSQTILHNSTVTAGQYITYTAKFCKSTNKIGTMTRYLVSLNGDATITLSPSGLADAKITDISKTVTVQIPELVKPGRYKVRWVVVYTYFGIREVSISWETPEFRIVN
jgi:hypothetical protein